ncbi:radical SAM protein [Pseudomonas sp. S31]|nr:radical SAM protein [Pseudomonas sp. S31]
MIVDRQGRRFSQPARQPRHPALQRILVRALADKQALAFAGAVTVMKVIGG